MSLCCVGDKLLITVAPNNIGWVQLPLTRRIKLDNFRRKNAEKNEFQKTGNIPILMQDMSPFRKFNTKLIIAQVMFHAQKYRKRNVSNIFETKLKQSAWHSGGGIPLDFFYKHRLDRFHFIITIIIIIVLFIFLGGGVKILNFNILKKTFCGFSMGRNQYWATRVYNLCVFLLYDGNSRRLNRKWFYGEAGNRTCDPWFTRHSAYPLHHGGFSNFNIFGF